MIEHFYYLIALLVAISGLVIIDYRWKLAFWLDAKRTALTLIVSILVFILWDVIGIGFGIFFKGSSAYMLPFELAPEFPLEELFFLFLLTYNALTLYRGYKIWRPIS